MHDKQFIRASIKYRFDLLFGTDDYRDSYNKETMNIEYKINTPVSADQFIELLCQSTPANGESLATAKKTS